MLRCSFAYCRHVIQIFFKLWNTDVANIPFGTSLNTYITIPEVTSLKVRFLLQSSCSLNVAALYLSIQELASLRTGAVLNARRDLTHPLWVLVVYRGTSQMYMESQLINVEGIDMVLWEDRTGSDLIIWSQRFLWEVQAGIWGDDYQ